MTSLSEILAEACPSGVYVLDASIGVDVLQEAADRRGLAFFLLQGTRARSKEELLRHAADVLRFPDYFGENWDAFADCLTDFSWIEQDGFMVVYKDSLHFADGQPDQFAIALDIFHEAAEFWKKGDKPFLTLLTGDVGSDRKLPLIGLECEV